MSNDNGKVEVRDFRQGDWLWTHKAVLYSHHIGATDFKVYCGLASYAGNADQKSWPSLVTLAERINLSKSSVIRSLQQLELCKVISVERRDGTSNVYTLLPCIEVQAPAAPTRAQSDHHRLIDFFDKTALKARAVKVIWSPKDVMQLKRVLKLNLIKVDQMEQLILYFLASPKYMKFSPSMATFFSSGIFNGLMNELTNGPEFWKNLDQYAGRFVVAQARHAPVAISLTSMSEMLKALSTRMQVPA